MFFWSHIMDDCNILSRFYVAGFSLVLSVFDRALDSIFLSNLVRSSREYEASILFMNQTNNIVNPVINFFHISCKQLNLLWSCFQLARNDREFSLRMFLLSCFIHLFYYCTMGITECLYLCLILIKIRHKGSECYIVIGSLLKCIPILLQNMPEIFLMFYFANIAVELLLQNPIETVNRIIKPILYHRISQFFLR